MKEKLDCEFLGQRMRDLRTKNGLSQGELAKKLGYENKSTISRFESGTGKASNLSEAARKYCELFGLSERQTEQFLRGEKIVVPDTSALLKNVQLIDALNKEYTRVIIAEPVIKELRKIKDRDGSPLSKKAREILKGISYGGRTVSKGFVDGIDEYDVDSQVMQIAKNVAVEYGSRVDIITSDTDYSATLKGNDVVSVLSLREYMITKQPLVNMMNLNKINEYYSDDYSSLPQPDKNEVNAYLPNGNTLLIETVRKKGIPFEYRREKVKWLLSLGADVDRKDCSRRFLPPLSHAIQLNDEEMFSFLLEECKANPNAGSRNPFGSGKVRQKNEGNMPLMIAAWHGRATMVEALCNDPRTSLNQQDENGFTALIKACANGYGRCRDIIKAAGADTRIVDINEHDYEWHWDDFLDYGKLATRGQNKRRKR